jgi:hypothetical protein
VTDRRAFLSTLAGGLLAAPIAAAAQSGSKVHRVGYLSTAGSVFEPFRQGLRELGYVEGQNLVLDVRLAHGRLDRLPALAAELVRMRPDVIAAVSSPAIRATTTPLFSPVIPVAAPVARSATFPSLKGSSPSSPASSSTQARTVFGSAKHLARAASTSGRLFRNVSWRRRRTCPSSRGWPTVLCVWRGRPAMLDLEPGERPTFTVGRGLVLPDEPFVAAREHLGDRAAIQSGR